MGLARALATDADILLMDEAFSALDPLIRGDMKVLPRELQRELKKTVLFVTHDLEEAIEIGDRIAILRAGEIVQNGDPQEIVLYPADDYIAELTRKIDRGRVLRVGSVMEAARPRGAALLSRRHAPVGRPADHHDGAGEEVPVVEEGGAVVGAMSTVRMMVALGGGRHLGRD
ncbi:MAG: hypothetical protein OYH76_18785 [Defluviicoccus sp.]|nr:hypothetical protein [Defluviicoccus sp.]MDE0277945.1 hypothetical protein [Defluviicoccus sp.]